MARSSITRTVKRDKYGRFAGKGGLKPYKSNLKGVTRKGTPNRGTRRTTGTVRKASRRKRVLIGAAVVGTVALGVASARKDYTGRRPAARASSIPRAYAPSARPGGVKNTSRYNRTFSTNRYGVTRVA